jgi:hypothetical protein
MESTQQEISTSPEVEIAETSDQSVNTDGAISESLDVAQESSTETKVDWWNPETWGKTPPKEIVKKIQSKYNENATKVKTLEKDYHVAQKELEAVVTDVKRALSDKKYYEERRRSLGYVDESPKIDAPTLDFSKFETVGDVQNAFENLKGYFENKISDIEQRATQKAEAKIHAVAAPIAQERWTVALKEMKNKYGDVWDSVERNVATLISNGRYNYQPGQEKELLDKVFRAEHPKEYESVIVNNLKKQALSKKGAVTTTARPQAPKLKPSGSSVDSAIERVNALLGPNTLRK